MTAILKQSEQVSSMTTTMEISGDHSSHLGSTLKRLLIGSAGALAVLAALALALLKHPKPGEIPQWGDIVWLASLLGLYALGCLAMFAAPERIDLRRPLRKAAVAVAVVLAALVLLYAIALLVALIGSVISSALESLGTRDSDDSGRSGEGESHDRSSSGYHGGWTFGHSSDETAQPTAGSGRGHSEAHQLRCLRCGAPTMGGLCEYCRGARPLLG